MLEKKWMLVNVWAATWWSEITRVWNPELDGRDPHWQLLLNNTSHRNQDVLDSDGGDPRVVDSTAAFHARVRRFVSRSRRFEGNKMFLSHPLVKLSIVGSLRDREAACSASDLQGLNFVSGGQCHLIHLTILRRLSWPNLAYMCTKVAWSPTSYI